MDPSNIVQLVIIVILLILSGVFSSAETALTTVNLNKLRAIADDEEDKRRKKAARVIRLREDSTRLLTAILIGNNIVNLSVSALVTTFATNLFGSKTVGIATGILTILVLIFGEITPKSLATLHNLSLSLLFSGPTKVLMTILTPLIWLLNAIVKGLLFILRVDMDANPDAMTEGELRKVVDVSHEEGVIEKSEMKMITNVVDFGDAISKDIMTPRADMVCLDVSSTFEDVIRVLEQENYSRIPIFNVSKDHIIGVLHVKDLIIDAANGGRENVELAKLMRKPIFVYEYQRTAEIFSDMKTSGSSMCIVLDEYGITAGLITMEDLIEEIVGDIRDEYDTEEEEWIKSLGGDRYDVEGSVKLDDLNDALGTDLESENYDSVGGYVIELLDRLPEEGDFVADEKVTIRVTKVEKKRVERVELVVLKRPGDEKDDGNSKDSEAE